MNFLAWLERLPFGQLLAFLLIAWAAFMADDGGQEDDAERNGRLEATALSLSRHRIDRGSHRGCAGHVAAEIVEEHEK